MPCYVAPWSALWGTSSCGEAARSLERRDRFLWAAPQQRKTQNREIMLSFSGLIVAAPRHKWKLENAVYHIETHAILFLVTVFGCSTRILSALLASLSRATGALYIYLSPRTCVYSTPVLLDVTSSPAVVLSGPPNIRCFDSLCTRKYGKS